MERHETSRTFNLSNFAV